MTYGSIYSTRARKVRRSTGWLDCHAGTKPVFSFGQNQLVGKGSDPASPSMRPRQRQDRKCGSEKVERLPSVIVRE